MEEYYIIQIKEGVYLRNKENYFGNRIYISTAKKILLARKYKHFKSAERIKTELSDYYNMEGFVAVASELKIIKITITQEVVG